MKATALAPESAVVVALASSARQDLQPADDLARFAKVVSHDFSGPLLAIRGFAAVLADTLGERIDAQERGYLSEIITAAKMMQALNGGLVSWVRARDAVLTFTQVSLEAVVSDCLTELHARIDEVSARVTVSPLPVVRADAAAIRVVIYNLLDNALRYTDPSRSPTIHIEATQRANELSVVVRDNGPGVAAINRDRVFALFQRLEPGRYTDRPGVGLTVSRTIMEKHGGRLWFDASSKGGAEAILTLPLDAIEVSDAARPNAPATHYAPERRRLVQSEAALAAIVEFSDDAIYSKNLDGLIITWNRAAESLYGYSAVEAVGRHVSLLVPDDNVHELPALMEQIRAGTRIHVETVRICKDGKRIDVSLTISPIWDATRDLVGASVIARDVTEQHKTEDHLRAFLEVAPDAIVVIGRTGAINAVNSQAQSTFGYTADELIGRPLEMLIPERFRRDHLEYLRAFTAAPKLRPMGSGLEFHGLRRDGTEFPVDIQLSTIPTKDGVLPVAAIRDITERRRLEHLRDDFISNAAHELRTPLTTLAGLAETLAGRFDCMPRSDIEDAFAAMARQGERARVLIANLLDLSNIEGGRADFTIADVEVGPLVERVLESTPPPDGKTVTLSVPADVIVRFDPVRLEQVVTNLLVNAYRYGGGEIRIVAESEAGKVIVSIADDGAGVAPYFVPELFEPFTRGKQTNVVRGSGIGLALCRRVVRSMGGDIWYEPNSPRGASFRVSLRRSS